MTIKKKVYPLKSVRKAADGKNNHFLACLVFSVCCVVLNFALRNLAALIGVPLYLDSVGTILAGALGGYLPGVLVGYFSNLLLNLTSDTAQFYAVISILIGALAAFLHRKGLFRSFGRALCSVPLFALIGGGIGSVLTYCLYGRGEGAELSLNLVNFFEQQGLQDVFLRQLSADFLLDLADKLVTVVLAALRGLSARPGGQAGHRGSCFPDHPQPAGQPARQPVPAHLAAEPPGPG